MVYAIKNLLHKSSIKYELWHFKGHQDEGMKREESDELGQANVLVDMVSKYHLASIPLDQIIIYWLWEIFEIQKHLCKCCMV